MRCLMVWIPNWEINALVVDIPPGAHGAIEERGHVKTVTPSARKCGVRQGMRVSMARYLCPDLLILPSDPRRELNSFEVIVQAWERLGGAAVKNNWPKILLIRFLDGVDQKAMWG